MLEIKNLKKTYANGVQALKGVNVYVHEGEFLVVIGLSGSGKSTLLRCINRLIPFTEGSITFLGKDVNSCKGNELRKLRSQIGMIFQHFNLIPRRSVLENILTGLLGQVSTFKSIFSLYTPAQIDQAYYLIKLVGLQGREHDRADNLSGGQQQRVAIARALMQKPKLLLADEPVASLDPATSGSVMNYLKKASTELGVTIICNLHFLSLVRQYATRVIALRKGELVYQGDPLDIDDHWFKKIYGEDAMEVTIR